MQLRELRQNRLLDPVILWLQGTRLANPFESTQLVTFFPELWSAEELEEWGKFQ